MTLAIVIGAALVVAISASASPVDGAEATGRSQAGCGGVATITLANQPVASFAPLHVGVRYGFFRKNRIRLNIGAVAASGAEALAAVMSGKDDVGFADWVTILQAYGRGLPMRVLAPGASAGLDRGNSYISVLVPRGSSIRGPSDFAGKTIGVNALGNINQIAIQGALLKRGVDITGMKFVVVPYPDTQAALERGSIDAAFMVEPFLSVGLAAGDRAVLYPIQDVMGRGSIANYVTSANTLRKKKCVMDRFVRAMNQASKYTQTHPVQARRAIRSFTSTPPDIVAVMKLPTWGGPFGASAASLAAVMVRLGLLEKVPDLKTLVAYPTVPTK
jgi:NitT/TauT family transport system substrate-binding protein